MAPRTRVVLSALAATVLLLSIATDSIAQNRRRTTNEPVLRGNPRRDAGGSCVYDKQGRVVFAPDGKHCPDGTDHLSKESKVESPILSKYPPEARRDLSRLLADHDHLAGEIARLRKAVENRDQAVALEAVEKVRLEITDHRAREEAFLENFAPRTTNSESGPAHPED